MAVCVLGCRVGSPALERRVLTAAQAFKDEMSRGGRAPIVVACGGLRWDGISEADAIAELLQESGVPNAKIVRERESRDTFENAAEAAKILADKPTVLVTCTWHLPRARLLFERAGVKVVRVVGAPPPTPGLLRRFWWYGRERVSTWKDLQR